MSCYSCVSDEVMDALPRADFDDLSKIKEFYGKVHQELLVTTDRGERAGLCYDLLDDYGRFLSTCDNRALSAMSWQLSNPSLEQITAEAERTLPANCQRGEVTQADFNTMPREQQLAVNLVQINTVSRMAIATCAWQISMQHGDPKHHMESF